MGAIKDLPKADRPRERLVSRGASALSDQALLAVILGRGTAGCDVLSIARRVIGLVDQKGLELTVRDLVDIPGMGQAKACQLCAAFEFVRRRICPEGIKIHHPEDILSLVRHFVDRQQEHFLCISLNGAHEVIRVRVVTIGLVDQSHVHPREVFADVIADRASGIIVAHNHPSGQVRPSRADLEITQRLKAAGEILGIELLDHVIFSAKDYYSLADHAWR